METVTYKQYVLLFRNYFRKPVIRLLGKLIAIEHTLSLGTIGLQFNFLCFIHFLLIG